MGYMGVAALAVIAVALAIGAATVSAPLSHAAPAGQEVEQGAGSDAALDPNERLWRIFKNEIERLAKRFDLLRKAFASEADDLVAWASAANDLNQQRVALVSPLYEIARAAKARVASIKPEGLSGRNRNARKAVLRAFTEAEQYFSTVSSVLSSFENLRKVSRGTFDRRDLLDRRRGEFDKVHSEFLKLVGQLRLRAQKLEKALTAANGLFVQPTGPPVSPKIIDNLSDPRVPKKGTPLIPLVPVSKALCPEGVQVEGFSLALQPVGPGETGLGSVGFNCRYRERRVGEGGKATAVSFRWGDGSRAERVPFCAQKQVAVPWRKSRTHDIQVYVAFAIDGADKLRQTFLKKLERANIALKC